MNYRVVKNSKSNIIHYQFGKNINHNKASNIAFSFTKHFIKICKAVLSLMFSSTKYNYDQVSDTCKPCNNNYYFKDVYDLKLKASQRTFL